MTRKMRSKVKRQVTAHFGLTRVRPQRPHWRARDSLLSFSHNTGTIKSAQKHFLCELDCSRAAVPSSLLFISSGSLSNLANLHQIL